MCGIFFVSLKTREFSQEFMNNNFDKLSPRGPDNSQMMTLGSKHFGFKRLAINDLSDSGNQPFVIDNIILICNGEIYNYSTLKTEYNIQTNSTSDCEIIIHLYKLLGIRKTIKLLDGVFAFVLFDRMENKIYVGRDIIGIRPLFYQIDKNMNVGIASEAKALENFHFSSTQQLSGGYLLEIQSNQFTFTKYFSFQNPCITNTNKVSNTLFELLSKAVDKRLMSDRDIGCFLSGGLDSSVIASLLAKKCENIKTFSVGFEGSTDLKYAQKVANYIGSNHNELKISYEDAFNYIEKVIITTETYDITTIRASIPMYMLSEYIKKNFF